MGDDNPAGSDKQSGRGQADTNQASASQADDRSDDNQPDDNQHARESDDRRFGDEYFQDGEERGRQWDAWVPDLVKRTLFAGMGAIGASEEGVRRLASEFSLPKDVASYLISQVNGTKQELFRIVGGEMRAFSTTLISQRNCKPF